MSILVLVRNYLPSHAFSESGGWDIADCVERAYDIEGMSFGTIGAGRIGVAVLQRLKAFGLSLHYTQRHRLAPEIEADLQLTFHADAESLVRAVDIVNLQLPLYPSTEHLLNDAMFAKMKRGAYLINTARGKLVERDAVIRALQSGQLAAYAGDVCTRSPLRPTIRGEPCRSMA